MRIIEKKEYEMNLERANIRKEKTEKKLKFEKKTNHQSLSQKTLPVNNRSYVKSTKSMIMKSNSEKKVFNEVRGRIEGVVKASEAFNMNLDPNIKSHQRSYIMNLNQAMKSSLSIINKAGLGNSNFKFSKIARHSMLATGDKDNFGRKDLKI